MSDGILMSLIGEDLFAALRVPDGSEALLTGRGQEAAIGRPCKSQQKTRWLLIFGELMSSSGIEQGDSATKAASSDPFAIRRPCHNEGVALDIGAPELIGIGGVPDLDRAIITAGGDPLVVGRPGQISHVVVVIFVSDRWIGNDG